MMTLLIAGHQLRLLSKSRGLLALFVAAPLLMIFVFGQAFTGIFNATGAGIAAADYFGVTLFTMAVFQGSFIAAWGIFKERKANADSRLYLAPLGRGARRKALIRRAFRLSVANSSKNVPISNRSC